MANSKTNNFNVIKAKYKINKIYLIKVKYQLLVVDNLRLNLYAQLLFLITFFHFLGYSYACHKGEI